MPAALFWIFLPLHLALNLASIAVCAVRGQLGVVLKAKRDALAGLPAALRQRREVQGGRKAGIANLLAVMNWGLPPR
jgi:hypothetical protein